MKTVIRTMSSRHELKSDYHEYNPNGCADCHRPFTLLRRKKTCWGKLCQKPLCQSCLSYVVQPEAQKGFGPKQHFGLVTCCKDWCAPLVLLDH